MIKKEFSGQIFKKVTYKTNPHKLSTVFSMETLCARREWNNIFKILKNRNHQPRIIYPTILYFQYEDKIKVFSDKS